MSFTLTLPEPEPEPVIQPQIEPQRLGSKPMEPAFPVGMQILAGFIGVLGIVAVALSITALAFVSSFGILPAVVGMGVGLALIGTGIGLFCSTRSKVNTSQQDLFTSLNTK